MAFQEEESKLWYAVKLVGKESAWKQRLSLDVVIGPYTSKLS